MRAIVFDFDGTITYENKNVWKWLWQKAGYDLGEGSIFQNLYSKYMNKEFSYKKWCDITCNYFKQKGINKKDLLEYISKTKILPGFVETVKLLRASGIKLFILSGNILECIKTVLGENVKYFDDIMANDFIFDKNENLDKIVATDYEHEGKAKYVNKVIKNLGISPEELTFVGNSKNDERVYLTGCNTLCINPDETEYKNKLKWNYCIEKANDFREVLPYLA